MVSYVYDAWGRPISKTGTLASTLGTVQPFRYRGYIYDEETGLYYLRSRFYNQNNSRFLNADVLISKRPSPLAHMLFTYCQNNPVKYSDPTGMESTDSELTAKERHYRRLDYYQDYPDVFDPSFFAGWDDTVPADCHQFTAVYGPNVKYVSPDGLHEVIYDALGNEVTDPRDIGTYNYVSPNEDEWRHFVEDVYPWILWGNSPEDTTTREQRIKAFAAGTGIAAPAVEAAINAYIFFFGEPE